MLQIILTFLIVGTAIGITLFKVVTYFTDPLRGCSGCSSGCGGCSLEELKKELEQKKGSHIKL